MGKKKAFITGIAGQDGPYLAELLLGEGYEVHGLIRSDEPRYKKRISSDVVFHVAEFIDTPRITEILEKIIPDEIYNLVAQSSVAQSFISPELTWEVNYHAFGRFVTAVLTVNPQTRIYQASTSEMFGNSKPPQNEQTPFSPQSPYAEAKTKAHLDYVVRTREETGAFIVSGFLFNHESPYRGEQYVTRKITRGLARIEAGMQEYLELGNLSAVRDWGHAQDYVRAMYMMLQTEIPEDFVIASGEAHSIRDFVEKAARGVGTSIFWEGEGIAEVGRNEKTGAVVVKVNSEFYRPAEVNFVQGDSGKARTQLGWKPVYSFEELVSEMVEADRQIVKQECSKNEIL